MYCTLQEAYNIPSFDPPSRKKKCSPDAQTKGPDGGYEAYRRDGGNGNGDFTMYKYATPKAVQAGPMGNKPLQRRIPYETFENYGPGEKEMVMAKTTYQGREADRRHYCETYGICSPDQLQEGFVGGAPIDDGRSGQALGAGAGAGAPSKVGSSAGSDRCQSAPDFYELPLSDETKKQFQQAMKTNLDQKTSSTVHTVPPMRHDSMKNVSGYYDEDLEQYLKSSEANSIPKKFPMNPDAKPTDVLHDPKNSPLQRTIARFSDKSIREHLEPEKLTGDKDDSKEKYAMAWSWNSNGAGSYGWDLAMFILAGLLIIFLIDQLFKMGVMLGMRHTVEMLEPFMKELREIAKK